MCMTQNPDAFLAKPFLKYPKVSINCEVGRIRSISNERACVRLAATDTNCEVEEFVQN